MASEPQVEKAILERIAELIPNATENEVLTLAEAFAWIVSPRQSHGSSNGNQKGA